MRILHVVPLVGDDGAFGGPTRVALNQAAELRRRGHEVMVAAAWRGAGEPPSAVDGVPVHLFRAHRVVPAAGISGLGSPGLVRWLHRWAPTADIVHVHAGRDLVSTSVLAVLHRRAAFVVQTHGMVTPDHRVRARIVDAVAIRRLLGAARRHLVLHVDEERQLQEVLGRRARTLRLPNGVPAPVLPGVVPVAGRVLFCARLHRRKRPLAFLQMARLVAERVPSASFRLVGSDEGELGAVRAAITAYGLSGSVHYAGALPYEQVVAEYAAADVYVLPSVDEPFPMSVLEAMSVGTPCVITDSCGISGDLARRRAAWVSERSPAALASAVVSLLGDAELRRALGACGRATARDSYSMGSVVDRLETVYIEAALTPGGRR